MPRKPIPSTTVIAAVRAYFGLDQEKLAPYLRVSRGMVAHLEAGRRVVTAKVLARLNPLAALVPDTLPPPLPDNELPATAPAPAPAPLDARRDVCLWKAARLRRELRAITLRASHAHRWQRALPALLAALPPADFDTHLPTDEESARVWSASLRDRAWFQRHAAALDAADVAEWHLLRLQAEALETEAAALARLLAPAP